MACQSGMGLHIGVALRVKADDPHLLLPLPASSGVHPYRNAGIIGQLEYLHIDIAVDRHVDRVTALAPGPSVLGARVYDPPLLDGLSNGFATLVGLIAHVVGCSRGGRRRRRTGRRLSGRRGVRAPLRGHRGRFIGGEGLRALFSRCKGVSNPFRHFGEVAGVFSRAG